MVEVDRLDFKDLAEAGLNKFELTYENEKYIYCFGSIYGPIV